MRDSETKGERNRQRQIPRERDRKERERERCVSQFVGTLLRMSNSYTPSGNQEQDWVNLLMASPLFKQINDLEQMLNKSASATGADASASDIVQGIYFIHLFMCLFVSFLVCVSAYLITQLFICLFMYLFIHSFYLYLSFIFVLFCFVCLFY